MPTILIADASKASLVMSSEVFKDKIPGAVILVATTGKDCLELVQKNPVDMCVVDFDLPDADGVTLVAAMRKFWNGPILLTAYPDKVVEHAAQELFAFNDAGGWIRKPVKFDELSEKIDRFLLDRHRLGRRFEFEVKTLVVGKGAGRGKRAPKVQGRIVNLSLGGLCVALDTPFKMKGGQEFTVAVTLPTLSSKLEAPNVEELAKATAGKKATATTKTTKAGKPSKKAPGVETKLKATVAWTADGGKLAGFKFDGLTDAQRKGIETLLRDIAITPAS
jgi:CheY-like chemotaxis protein